MRQPQRRSGDIVAGTVLWAMAAIIVQQSTTWPIAGDVAGNPTVFPRALAAIMFGCGLVLFVFRRPAPEEDAAGMGARSPVLTLATVGATVLLAVSLEPFGLVPAGIAFLIVAQRIAGAPWRSALSFAVGTPILIWLVFVTALSVPLPRGEVWLRLFS
ncbi:MAG: tripartite tricarboxylate transporter TctB family protein [Burkholderiales bacterium]|nr:tripartite tricarboxylate transporter TctB family protein [Burkholderiales bacterium]